MNANGNRWDEADLERRLCQVLDLAARVVATLGEEGYSEAAGEEDRLPPEKIVSETAVLLLSAYVATGGADPVAAHGGIRRRVHQIAEQLAPLARGERTMLSVCLQPSLALDFATAHICLTRMGYPDLRFDKVLHEALWNGVRPTKERSPHRQLEQEWLLWMGSVPTDSYGRQRSLAQSALARPMDLLGGSRDDVYAFTHALMYGRDFDCLPLPLPRSRDEILGEAEAALTRCLEEDDFDLAGEVLLAWPLSGQVLPGDETGRSVWSPAAAFGFELLSRVEDRAGFLPSPATRVDIARALPEPERRRYLLASAYHTVYVMGLLCAAALTAGKAPPASVEPDPAMPSGAAQKMLGHLDDAARSAVWFQEFQLLDLDQQDALAGLVFQIAMRRKFKLRDYPGMMHLLLDADSLGLAQGPLATQAAQLLGRLQVLSGTIGERQAGRAKSRAAAA